MKAIEAYKPIEASKVVRHFEILKAKFSAPAPIVETVYADVRIATLSNGIRIPPALMAMVSVSSIVGNGDAAGIVVSSVGGRQATEHNKLCTPARASCVRDV